MQKECTHGLYTRRRVQMEGVHTKENPHGEGYTQRRVYTVEFIRGERRRYTRGRLKYKEEICKRKVYVEERYIQRTLYLTVRLQLSSTCTSRTEQMWELDRVRRAVHRTMKDKEMEVPVSFFIKLLISHLHLYLPACILAALFPILPLYYTAADDESLGQNCYHATGKRSRPTDVGIKIAFFLQRKLRFNVILA